MIYNTIIGKPEVRRDKSVSKASFLNMNEKVYLRVDNTSTREMHLLFIFFMKTRTRFFSRFYWWIIITMNMYVKFEHLLSSMYHMSGTYRWIWIHNSFSNTINKGLIKIIKYKFPRNWPIITVDKSFFFFLSPQL